MQRSGQFNRNSNVDFGFNRRSPVQDSNEYEEYEKFQRYLQWQEQQQNQNSRPQQNYNSRPQQQNSSNYNSRPQQQNQQSTFCRHKPITRQLVAATLIEEYTDISTCPYSEVTIKYVCAECNRIVFINPLAVGSCYGTNNLFIHFKQSKKQYERATILDYTHKKISKTLLDQCVTLIRGEENNAVEEEKNEVDEKKLRTEEKRKEIEEERKKNASEKESAIKQRFPPPKRQ